MRTGSISAIIAVFLSAAALPVVAQKPVIDSSGVMNAATLAPVAAPNFWGPSHGSIATILGQNFAAAAATAMQIPLPTTLAGVSVVWQHPPSADTPLPLFYVSPGQINFQIPNNYVSALYIAVQTPNGTSDPVLVHDALAPGIFTLNGSGCGPAWVFNIAPDGTWSLNSPDNSVEPGGLIAILATGRGAVFIFGTGQFIPDGQPTPASPLLTNLTPGPVGFEVPTDGEPSGGTVLYDNRAPGMIGVDQYNLKLPDNVIEGCGIPLTITVFPNLSFWDSQPVPINVHRGGGKCGSLPPPRSYADLTLQKTTTIDTTGSTTTEQLNVNLSAAVGKRVPQPPPTNVCSFAAPADWVSGPACPFPLFLDQPVNVGPLTISGPNVNLRYVQQPDETAFHVTLPGGSLVPGSYTVSAPGGKGAGPFSVAIPVPAEIQFDNPVPGGTIDETQNFQVKWTGGEPDSVVRVRLRNLATWNYCEAVVPASAGSFTLYASYKGSQGYLLDQSIGGKYAELTITLESPASVPFTAPGLTLGGTARSSRVWYYPNLQFTFGPPPPQ
jgi:uncharacterized protein (TIGR03437 family)